MSTALKRWIGRVPDLSAVIARFPVAVAIMAIFTLLLIFEDVVSSEEQLARLLAGLAIGGYVSVCWTVSREGRGLKPLWLFEVGIAVIIALLAWHSKSLMLNIVMAVGAILLWLGNSVRNRRGREDLHVWDFTHKIWTGAAFAALGSIIFLVGTFAIAQALKSLFGVDIRDLVQELILPVGLGFLAPVYWLSTVPQANESHAELTDSPGFVSRAVAFLGTWLLSPLTLIYAAILLAYGVKIIMEGTLPKGEIAQLSTPFLIIGALTWLVLEPPFIRDKLPAKLFRKTWFFLSVPVAILLAIAIGVRIGQYGLTPERIALVFCVIWAIAVGLWFTFGPKDKRDIRLIPGVAAALLAFGAIFADRISYQSQISRAVTHLKEAGLMSQDGSMLATDINEISDADAARTAKGALRYAYRHAPEKTWQRFLDDPVPDDINYRYPQTDPFFKKMGLDEVLDPARNGLYTSYNDNNQVIDVAGYDRLYGPIMYYARYGKNDNERSLYDKAELKVVALKDIVKISKSDQEVGTFNFEEWGKALPLSDTNIIVDNPYIKLERTGTSEVTLKIQSISRNGRSDSEHRIDNVNFYVLIKEAEAGDPDLETSEQD